MAAEETEPFYERYRNERRKVINLDNKSMCGNLKDKLPNDLRCVSVCFYEGWEIAVGWGVDNPAFDDYRCNYEKVDRYHCQLHADLCKYLSARQHIYDNYLRFYKKKANGILQLLIRWFQPNLRNDNPDNIKLQINTLIKQYISKGEDIEGDDDKNRQLKRLRSEIENTFNGEKAVQQTLVFLASAIAAQIRLKKLTQCFYAQQDYGHVLANAVDGIIFEIFWRTFQGCNIDFTKPDIVMMDKMFSKIHSRYRELTFLEEYGYLYLFNNRRFKSGGEYDIPAGMAACLIYKAYKKKHDDVPTPDQEKMKEYDKYRDFDEYIDRIYNKVNIEVQERIRQETVRREEERRQWEEQRRREEEERRYWEEQRRRDEERRRWERRGRDY
jgi:hypothetical protein